MELGDYPRPPHDTGLGMHWAAVIPPGISLAEVRQKWLPELLAMNIKWVKILHDGGEGLAELFLSHGIMPIVRIYRYQPNPGRLSAEERMRVTRLARLGVSYIETNNEPNLKEEWRPGEWDKGNLPPRVVEDWIADAEFVLSQGALPGLPALSPGGHMDDVTFFRSMVDRLVKLGRRDLFEAGAWIAIHNYFLNHPPDYPYDDVAQAGRPLTAEEKAQLNLDPVTAARMDEQRKMWRSPGRHLREDSNGFLKHVAYRDTFVEAFGFEVPVLTTEGGAVWGRSQDPRYPPVNDALHQEYNLFAFEHMAGAPDYYFCNCPWLIANRLLGSGVRDWENNSWYSDLWDGGQLPIVAAVKNRAPWPVRTAGAPSERSGVISGRAVEGRGQAVVVRDGEGRFVASAYVEADDQYQVTHLFPGTYRVEVPGTSVARDGVTATNAAPTDLDLTVPPKQGRIEGRVLNGAGLLVDLYDRSDGERRPVDRVAVGPDERFVFRRLWAGTYLVAVVNHPGVQQDDIAVNGKDTVEIRLVVPRMAWKATITENSSGTQATSEKHSVLQIHVIDTPPTDVRVYPGFWEGVTVRTGSKPELGQFAAEADWLPAGTYTVEPVGLGITGQVFLDGRGKAVVVFQQEAVGFANSTIHGRVTGGVGQLAILEQDGAEVARAEIGADGTYRFADLAAGVYRVAVPEMGLWGQPVTVDGTNEVRVNLVGGTGPDPGDTEAKDITHYLLFGDPQILGSAIQYAIALPHVLRLGATFGFRQEDAARAKRVTIVGDTDAVASDVEAELRAAGCVVERLSGDEYALDAALGSLGGA